MDFFDKLALALVLWGAVASFWGLTELGFVEFEPAEDQRDLRVGWTRVVVFGVVLLAFATITWILT